MPNDGLFVKRLTYDSNVVLVAKWSTFNGSTIVIESLNRSRFLFKWLVYSFFFFGVRHWNHFRLINEQNFFFKVNFYSQIFVLKKKTTNLLAYENQLTANGGFFEAFRKRWQRAWIFLATFFPTLPCFKPFGIQNDLSALCRLCNVISEQIFTSNSAFSSNVSSSTIRFAVYL